MIFSSQFRRLQDKTQVFPLAKSDYTRTRLTHTMEVATVGMGLGKALGSLLAERRELPDHLSPADLGTVVSVACLAHDIGNPPFGHSGEKAIQEWAKRHASDRLKHLDEAELKDIKKFEGNAQSFRITARLWGRDREGGGQLTLASYGALFKYPQGSSHQKDEFNAAYKKFNYTQADAELAISVCDALSLNQVSNGQFARHPLVYLMEAADDICYRVVDIEDALDAGLITKARFCELMLPFQPNRSTVNIAKLEKKEVSEIRALAIGTLSSAVQKELANRLDDIREGYLETALVDTLRETQPSLYKAFEALSSVAQSDVYTNDRVLQIEFAGFKVIGGLLDEFMNALPPEYSTDERVELSASGAKLFKLFPPAYLEVRPELHGKFRGLAPEAAVAMLTPYERVLAITDYVSGMTDTFALELHQILTGVRVP